MLFVFQHEREIIQFPIIWANLGIVCISFTIQLWRGWKDMDIENNLKSLQPLNSWFGCSAFYIQHRHDTNTFQRFSMQNMPWTYTYWDVWQASYDDVCLNMRMGHKSSLAGLAWRGSSRLWCRPFLGEFPWVPSGIPGCWNAIDMLNVFSRSFAFVVDVPCVVLTFSKVVYRTKMLFLHCDLVLADSIFMDQYRPNT